MTDASSSMTTATRSRLIRAIHYEPKAQRLCVLTTHGKLHIHEGVPPETVELIADGHHPGYTYLAMKPKLGPKKSLYTPAGFMSARRAKRAIRQILN